MGSGLYCTRRDTQISQASFSRLSNLCPKHSPVESRSKPCKRTGADARIIMSRAASPTLEKIDSSQHGSLSSVVR